MCNRVTNHGDMSTFSKPEVKHNDFGELEQNKNELLFGNGKEQF